MGCTGANSLNYFCSKPPRLGGSCADITCFGQRSATLPPSRNPRPEDPDVKTFLGFLYANILFLCHLWEREILIYSSPVVGTGAVVGTAN